MTEPVHDLSGFLPLIRIPIGSDDSTAVVIPTYFIIISLSFCFSLFWLIRRTKARGLSRNRALDLATILIVSGMLGARLFHVLFEAPGYYWESPFRILEIWRGGFVWYGGAIVGALSGFFYLRYQQASLGAWLDVLAPICAFGYAFGRIACLATGCCYGAVCVLANGFRFRHPTQIYSIIWESLGLLILLWLERNRQKLSFTKLRLPGSLFFVWVLLHTIGRLVMELFRDDPRGFSPLGLSQGSWISLGILILFAFTALRPPAKGNSVKRSV